MHSGRRQINIPGPSCCYRNLYPVNPEAVAELIRRGLPGAQVLVQSDDNTHYAARVVSKDFAGKRPIARHQLIYKTLGELMGREIHAMSIEAFTPEEVAGRQS